MTSPTGTQQLIIEVPDALAVQVGEALQATYPQIIEGTTTLGEAMRAVIAWWTANLLSEFAATQARVTGAERVAQVQAEVEMAVSQARQRAWEAVEAVMTSGQLPDQAAGQGTVDATP